jgi:hypothetical protein
MVVGPDSEPKSDGYSPSGADSRDSAGEFSNFRLGDGVGFAQESMMLDAGSDLGRVRTWVLRVI